MNILYIKVVDVPVKGMLKHISEPLNNSSNLHPISCLLSEMVYLFFFPTKLSMVLQQILLENKTKMGKMREMFYARNGRILMYGMLYVCKYM
jgi:hypothetical protein